MVEEDSSLQMDAERETLGAESYTYSQADCLLHAFLSVAHPLSSALEGGGVHFAPAWFRAARFPSS